MNKKHLYHFDMKDANILIDSKNQIRIIDWGLGGIAKNNQFKNVPDALMGRSIQFNLPYSSIIINNIFPKLYQDYLKNKCQSNWKVGLHEFTLRYVDMWQEKRGEGHMPFIINDVHLVQPFYSKNLDPDNIVYNFIYKTLEKFTSYCHDEKHMKFNMSKFLDVFYHNVDIWGTLMCYITLFKYHKKDLTKLQNQQNVLANIAKLLVEFCYLNPCSKINIKQLKMKIMQLTIVLGLDYSKADRFTKKKRRTKKKIHLRKN